MEYTKRGTLEIQIPKNVTFIMGIVEVTIPKNAFNGSLFQKSTGDPQN